MNGEKGLKKRDRKWKKGREIDIGSCDGGYWFWLWPSGQRAKAWQWGERLTPPSSVSNLIRDFTSRKRLISVWKREKWGVGGSEKEKWKESKRER